MDLDDLDAPTKLPSRVSRFAPKSSKLKLKPKLEPQESAPKTEAPESWSKPEPREFDSVNAKTKEEESSAPNGAIKMDVDPKSEGDDKPEQDEPMDEDSAEDTVVREIDVFFTPSIATDTQLYVLQYPLRPCWRPYELDDRCEEVRLKPDSSEVEVDLSIDMESSNHDREFASKLKMTKQTLSTSWKPPCTNGYAVGLLVGNKLLLHPIHAVVQLRPSLEHFNSGGSKRKANISTSSNATIKIENSAEEKSVATSKKQNKQMESSVGEKSDGDEYWVPLKYHSSKSDLSSRYLRQMVAQESSPINFTMSPYDYVASLCPGVSNSMLSKGPSRRYLLSLPPEERLKKLLVEGSSLHRFSAIKHFAPEYSEEQLLEFLQQHALLVQGLWAPKSALLYPEGGVESLARDFALLLFSKNLKVQLSQFNVRNDLNKHLSNHIKNFLNVLGEKRTEDWKSSVQPIDYWKFREHPDESFIKRYPSIVAKYKGIMEGMEERVYGAVYKVGKGEPRKNAVPKLGQGSKPGQVATSDKHATSVGGVPPMRMTMSSDTRHALPIALKKLFQTHPVCSFQKICNELRGMAVSQSMQPKSAAKVAIDAALGLDAPPEELQAVISETASNIHGFYVLKSSPNEHFRDVVIDMLRGSGPNAKLRKAEVLEAAKRKLNREVTNSEYSKVMNELCVSRGSVWVLKTDDRTMQKL
ncbi:DNA-directed RNA polymerase III subunit RPC5 [Neltuma alba]|uniref:DNA-directed RNA polymerase III subunit RPC5 n=1 Tax=Neltuma alba TaxID=207710 RepID=UPI0010A4861E|nr:DNA-directed RNA polymerase III subunit RPC5 [Prosopis alba]